MTIRPSSTLILLAALALVGVGGGCQSKDPLAAPTHFRCPTASPEGLARLQKFPLTRAASLPDFVRIAGTPTEKRESDHRLIYKLDPNRELRLNFAREDDSPLLLLQDAALFELQDGIFVQHIIELAAK